MQIVFHIGAHCTDEGKITRALLRSRSELIKHGVSVPPPRRYRPLIRETLNILGGMVATNEVEDLLLETIVEEDGINRVVLLHENLICIPHRAIGEEGLYAMAARRIAAFARLFPSHDCEFHLGLCNPATLVPTLAQKAGPDGYEMVMAGADVRRLRWLSTIENIVQTGFGDRLTLWCNEDTPLIWQDVLRSLAGGVGSAVPLEGDLDLMAALLNEEGLQLFTEALAKIDPEDREARYELVGQMLASHSGPGELEIDIDLPDWTSDLVESLTETYIADCAAIAALPGVRFLTP
ncbi:MAG: hypothetical protein WBH04_04240 [Albidovulum sp.]